MAASLQPNNARRTVPAILLVEAVPLLLLLWQLLDYTSALRSPGFPRFTDVLTWLILIVVFRGLVFASVLLGHGATTVLLAGDVLWALMLVVGVATNASFSSVAALASAGSLALLPAAFGVALTFSCIVMGVKLGVLVAWLRLALARRN